VTIRYRITKVKRSILPGSDVNDEIELYSVSTDDASNDTIDPSHSYVKNKTYKSSKFIRQI